MYYYPYQVQTRRTFSKMWIQLLQSVDLDPVDKDIRDDGEYNRHLLDKDKFRVPTLNRAFANPEAEDTNIPVDTQFRIKPIKENKLAVCHSERPEMFYPSDKVLEF